MDLSQLHFAHPHWFWLLLAIPLTYAATWFFQMHKPHHHLEKFIDAHLLPYLLIQSDKKASYWKTMLFWSFAWICLTAALAGPRWSYLDIETYSRDQSLVILLDLSESMDAEDIKPSRLIRAKQKIEDLLQLSQGVKIGLVAFAADPHMITPLTEDKETIRHLLPSLATDLVFVQGSRLSSALDMASTMLKAEPGANKAVLVVSDGGFEDATSIKIAKKMGESGIVIHTMGVGTPEGAPIKKHLSKLDKARLNEISQAGHGHYWELHFSDQAEKTLLKELGEKAAAQANIGKTNRIWDEQFYLLIFPALPIFLIWFRRGYIFALLIFMPFNMQAFDLFKNTEEIGKAAFDAGDYEKARSTFQDPYRKGVACYKAGDFAKAEELFRQSARQEVACQSLYNLGNALVQQQKLQEAITAYEQVLAQWPEHTRAKENLEIVKKMLEQQQNQDKSSENQKENDQQKPEQSQPKKDQESEKGEQDLGSTDEEEQKPSEEEQKPSQQEISECDTQSDEDADIWLNKMTNDPKMFLKNKFYIESKRSGTKQGVDPW